MTERIGIVSARGAIVAPAQLCAMEFEHVLQVMLSAIIVPGMENVASYGHEQRFDRLIYVAMNYWQLSRMIERTATLRRYAGSCQAYVFDSFHRYLHRWGMRFPLPLHRAGLLLRHEMRNLRAMTCIFAPTSALIDEQQAFFNVAHTYLPIGVDAVAFGSERQDRVIDVNAYGRQPRAITDLLSDRLNVCDGPYRFHHTDHLASITIRDPLRHRALFWRMLADSKIALAYAPHATDDDARFDCAFVGQRWYEAIAAGCVVMGQKPDTPETEALFDWPGALIDLPRDPEAALAAMLALAADGEQLGTLSRRNHRAALNRHDWRHRVADMAGRLGIEPDARFRDELARAHAPAP